MRLNLKATNIGLTPDIREYLDKRLRSLDKLVSLEDESVLVDVELGRTTRHHQTGDICRAEINIHRGKEAFRAEAEAESLTAAIDLVRDEMARELTSGKEKRHSLVKRGGYFAKALLKSGYDGLGYLGRPVQAGWKYMKSFRPWRKD